MNRINKVEPKTIRIKMPATVREVGLAITTKMLEGIPLLLQPVTAILKE